MSLKNIFVFLTVLLSMSAQNLFAQTPPNSPSPNTPQPAAPQQAPPAQPPVNLAPPPDQQPMNQPPPPNQSQGGNQAQPNQQSAQPQGNADTLMQYQNARGIDPSSTAQPVQTFVGPGGKVIKGVSKKTPSLREIEANASKRVKSPFMIPTDLYLKIKRIEGEKVDSTVDNSVDPKRRWPLRSYSLVGVLTNVAKPKALIIDGSGALHTYKLKEFIANSGAFISSIEEGEVVIFERGVEFVMKLRSASGGK